MSLTIKTVATALPLLVAESSYQGVKSSVLGEWLVNAAAVGLIVVLALNLVDRFRGGASQKREIQQPLRVTKHEESVTDDELRQVHGRIARERKEIDDRLNALAAEDVRLREKLDDDISELNDRIDKVPERTINLLKSTKGLI